MRRLLIPALLCATSVLAAQETPQPNDQHVSAHNRDRAQHAFLQGAKAVRAQDIGAAIPEFADAARLDPTNRDYDAALTIARDSYATELMQRALKARLTGQTDLWLSLAKKARDENPHNSLVLEHTLDFLGEDSHTSSSATPSVDLAAPIDLKPAPGKHTFHLYIPRQQLIQQVLSSYGINAAIDSSVTSTRVHFDADDVDYDEAVHFLTMATDTFVTPLDPVRAIVAVDTPDNRIKFERVAVETVYLPGLGDNEINDLANMARNIFMAKQVQISVPFRTMTVRAPVTVLKELNQTLNDLLAGHSEIVLDCDMFEVQHQRTTDIGGQIPQSSSVFNVGSEVQNLISANPTLVQQIISSGLASPGNIDEIALALLLSGQAGSTLLSQPFAVFGGGLTLSALTLGNGATANLQLNSSTIQMVDTTKLRLLDQELGNVKVGTRYPIVTSNYSNLATGSTSIAGINTAGLSNTLQNLGVNLSTLSSAASATIPQVQYQDIGLTLEATPRIQSDKNVSLRLRLQISSLSGTTINSNPIINSREVNSIVDVHSGERTVIFSQLTHTETGALIGIPFLSEIPGLNMTTERTKNDVVNDLIVVITPHVVRLTRTQDDGRIVLVPTH